MQKYSKLCLSSALIAVVTYYNAANTAVNDDCKGARGTSFQQPQQQQQQQQRRNKLFTRRDVKSDPKLLATYRDGVYDLTAFAPIHPGGDEIHRCFHGSMDTYFRLFPHHKKADVLEILEDYRVGNLTDPVASFMEEECDTEAIKFHDPMSYNVEFIIEKDVLKRALSKSGVPTATVVTAEAEAADIKRYYSISDLKRFPQREMYIGVACGFNTWKDRWDEELAAHGGRKLHKGVWLGDILGHLGIDCNDKELIDQLFVHYHCFDDYIDVVPLMCVRRADTSLLVYDINGQALTADKPTPGKQASNKN